jgi:PHD/YefM family antitoxin component YafN of YafNO toxin-antitoxin module
MRQIPAEAIEAIVCERVAGLVTPDRSCNEIREHLRNLITRVEFGTERISIILNHNNLLQHVEAQDYETVSMLENLERGLAIAEVAERHTASQAEHIVTVSAAQPPDGSCLPVQPRQPPARAGPKNTAVPFMLTSFPASILNLT